jgi:hypothetical protein
MELFAHGGLLAANLLSPIVLAFLIGIIAGLVRSELEFPQPVLNAISIYLVLAIGIAGGVELSQADLAAVWRPALLAAGLALALPAWCYWILRRSGRFAISDAASLAAHYGSVSSVTFMAALTFATRASEAANDPSLRPEAFLPVLASLMEWGLLVALFIGRWRLARSGSLVQAPFGSLVLDALRARSVVLMLGGFLLGWLVGEKGFAPIKPVFADLFRGILVLYLLEMGMVAARQFAAVRQAGLPLLAFALLAPVLHGVVGTALGHWAGLGPGGAFVLGAICASASYIDAPAAVRSQLPQANPGMALSASLGVTFPFNLLVNLPLLWWWTTWLAR